MGRTTLRKIRSTETNFSLDRLNLTSTIYLIKFQKITSYSK